MTSPKDAEGASYDENGVGHYFRLFIPRRCRLWALGSHRDTIVDQFTKQASLFQATHRSAESAIEHAIRVSGVGADDVVLVVACGPGVLTCVFARVAAHVTGIDITPTMLEHARALQASSGVTNIAWQMGDVYHLPFEDGSFDLVFDFGTCYHVSRPAAALREIARVLRSGGLFVHESRLAQWLAHPSRASRASLPWAAVPGLLPHRAALLWSMRQKERGVR